MADNFEGLVADDLTKESLQHTIVRGLNKPITIRVSKHDLDVVKIKASKLGIPYQTYIKMLIHRDVIT